MTVSVCKLSLSELLVISPTRRADARGYFEETWNKRDLAQAGITVDFVQDNHSLSVAQGTLRGMHYQSSPHAQDKLVRCTRGEIFDVAVDARRGSPTYGAWAGVTLSAQNGKQLFIPKGFLHGFITREPNSEVQYKCSDYYDPVCDGSVRWDSLGIDWEWDEEPVVSEKDVKAIPFADFQSPFEFGKVQ